MKRASCRSRTPTSKAQTGTKRVRQSPPACREPENKAAEHRRTPKRKRHNGGWILGHVLECGTAVPLFHRCGLRFLGSSLLGASVPNRLQDVRDRFAARFGAEIAFAVDADANGVGFHVAFPDHE